MAAAVLDITIEQGSRFQDYFLWKDSDGNPVDVSSYTAKMQIREDKDKDSTLIHTVSNSNITLNSDGTIHPSISATDTGNFTFDWAWYDLIVIPPSGDDDAVRLVQGRVELDKQVTTV